MIGDGAPGAGMWVIAIDGPAGAGKSTAARAVADWLGLTYVDTGALYRALALAALEAGVEPDDPHGLVSIAEGAGIRLDRNRVLLGDRDVTDRIRTPDVTAIVSEVAAHPAVRRSMLDRQRRMAAAGGVVMEGRDIGTAVVPEADLKVYLTASLEERARRRWEEAPAAYGSLATVMDTIAARDRSDAGRSVSPLAQAADAAVVDSTDMSIADVVDAIVGLVETGDPA